MAGCVFTEQIINVVLYVHDFFCFFLQYLFFSEPAENEYVVSGGCFSLQDIAKS